MPDPATQPRKALTAAILPVYNEESNVGEVLDVLHRTELLDELILVDDGSGDRTPDVLYEAAGRDPRMRVIRHEKNKGKGQAIFTGWAATTAPYLLMLDADLKNLRPEHIHVLMEPVLEHRTDMTMGLFSGGHFDTDFSHWLTPILTGQRGLRAEILKYISREAAAGYGFEVALTIAAQREGYRRQIVKLKGVWHPHSEMRTERGYWFGWIWKFRMWGQILRAYYITARERHPDAESFFSDILKP